ncbi:MAG: PRC-barrel domain-containing protein [Clostridiales bacterium]|jgi:uncharacterized protein YrrD|nr:PRC-barrel domain-containing protein [Clostridiales bacterium]
MNKASKLLDLPVIGADGKRLGRITDILFDARTMRVAGYYVAAGTVLRIPRYLAAGSVQKIDGGGVRVADKTAFLPTRRAEQGENYKTFHRDAAGAAMIQNGGKIGRISDMLFRTERGEITRFEVSNGFAEDILRGRKNIHANKDAVFGNNNVEITDKGV